MKIADYGKAITSYIESPTKAQKDLLKLRAEEANRTFLAEGTPPPKKPRQLKDLFEKINRAVLAVSSNTIAPEFIVPELETLTQEYISDGLISGEDARKFAIERKDYWDKWISENPGGTTPTFDFDNEGSAIEVDQEEIIKRINEADGGRIGFKRGKLAVNDPALQATVKKLFEDGLSNSQVADKTGKSVSTIKRIKEIIGAGGQKEALMKSQAVKYTKLKDLIEKANDGLKFVEMQELRNLVDLPQKAVVSDLKNYEKFNIPKLDKASDKVKKAFLSIVENADTPVEEVFDITSNIGSRTNLSTTSVSKFLNQLPEYKEFKPIALKLQSAAFKTSVANKGLTLNDVMEMADAPKFKTVAATNTPENFIIESAKRHVNQGGNQIEFLKMPGTLDKNGNLLSNADAEFTYKGKTYTYDDLRIKGNNLPVFKEVYKKFEDLENLLSKEVTHPLTKEKINFRTLMSEAYNKGAGYSYAKSPYEIDHFKTVKDSPFNDLRILPRRINMVQGMIVEKGKQAESGFLKGAAEDYTPEKVKAYIKKSGYDFTKDIDKLATDETKLANDILVKNRKLRSPVQIGKEIFKNVGKKTLKAIPVVGTAIGISDVAQALEMGITNPVDLFAAYQISPEVALASKKYREDPEYRAESLAKTMSTPLDEGTFEAIDEQTSTFGKYNDQIKNIKLP